MYERAQVRTLIDRLSEPVGRLIVVSGPRQTGKTTLVRQALDRSRPPTEYHYVAVDEPESSGFRGTVPRVPAETDATPPSKPRDERWLTEQWERARWSAERIERGFVLVLDEAHKIGGWSETVKGLWDADRAGGRELHVVLLGSAPLLVQRGLTESLAGRFELIRVTHWSFLEMHEAFDLDLPRYLYFGGYPGSAPLISEEARWRDYIRSALVEPNISKDILMMTHVEKPALLRRLFELGCSYSGEILSYNKMLGQLQDAGNATTLAHYLDLLTHAGLLVGLQKFAGREHRKRASSPKLNVLNTALLSAGSGYTFDQLRADRTIWGRLVESAVGAHLHNTGMPDIRLRYWRESPHEVDFILERGNMTVGVEVKSATRSTSTRGLDVFRERFCPHRTLLVGEGGVPLETFLSTPAHVWFEPT